MKCAVAFSVLLAACSVVLADSPDPRTSARPDSSPSLRVLEDLVRMSKTGASDAAVLGYARAHRVELPAEIPDKTLRWLRASGVSERVVRYMSAIDVRASEWPPNTPEGVTWADEDRDRDDVMERPAERESGRSYGDAEAYAGYDSDSGSYGFGDNYDSGFGYDPYFYFGYPYLSAPYYSYFFVDRRGDFFQRFGGHRNHRGHRDPRFDGGGSRSRDRSGSRDAWRDRGSGGRRAPIAMGPRNAGRSFAGGGFRGSRGGARTVGPRGFAPPRSARGSFSPGFVGPRSHEMRGFRNSAPSRGTPSRSGGGLSRGSTATSGGGRGRR